MRSRKLLWLAPLLASGGVAVAVMQPPAAPVAVQIPGEPDVKPATKLPITQVVLFNSGVGYFARSGDVTGNARVDLTFPEKDINDLLKSMTLQDLDKGRVESVSYDSKEPVGRTLASFAINLSDNPTLAQILGQARGERVEVSLPAPVGAGVVVVTGTILSIERQKLPAGKDAVLEVDVLNLLTAEGMRALKMTEVQRIQFTNPQLEAELKRALEVLAQSHDTQKKAVTLNFAGEGKRRVKVGYVVEAPIWKTSYRLVLDKDGAPYLQGWALVENPTDEDWSGVKVALVSGRPISFKMDLYNPLYVPRPTVEPELFASLRPPTYEGGIGAPKGPAVAAAPPASPAPAARMMRKSGTGSAGGPPAADAADKEFAGNFGAQLAEKMDLGSVASAATAGKLGDSYQYVIDHAVNLPRQKSAMLPIVGSGVEGSRVSIYNERVQPKHPLLGLKFKNTSGANLAQGPVTVFDGSTYAGDARLMDIQPGEERLIAYAIDLGTEVVPQYKPGTSAILSVKAQRGIVTTVRKFKENRVFKIANRSETDRTVLVEVQNRTNQGYKLVEPAKPAEETADVLRFSVKVAAGKTAELKVVEERNLSETVMLSNTSDDTIRYFIGLGEASPELKKVLQDALALKAKWDAARTELQQVNAQLQAINQDQDRIRKNIKETPKEAPVFKTWLDKLSDQEKQIDTLTAKQKELQAAEQKAKAAYEQFLAGITVG